MANSSTGKFSSSKGENVKLGIVKLPAVAGAQGYEEELKEAFLGWLGKGFPNVSKFTFDDVVDHLKIEVQKAHNVVSIHTSLAPLATDSKTMKDVILSLKDAFFTLNNTGFIGFRFIKSRKNWERRVQQMAAQVGTIVPVPTQFHVKVSEVIVEEDENTAKSATMILCKWCHKFRTPKNNQKVCGSCYKLCGELNNLIDNQQKTPEAAVMELRGGKKRAAVISKQEMLTYAKLPVEERDNYRLIPADSRYYGKQSLGEELNHDPPIVSFEDETSAHLLATPTTSAAFATSNGAAPTTFGQLINGFTNYPNTTDENHNMLPVDDDVTMMDASMDIDVSMMEDETYDNLLRELNAIDPSITAFALQPEFKYEQQQHQLQQQTALPYQDPNDFQAPLQLPQEPTNYGQPDIHFQNQQHVYPDHPIQQQQVQMGGLPEQGFLYGLWRCFEGWDEISELAAPNL